MPLAFISDTTDVINPPVKLFTDYYMAYTKSKSMYDIKTLQEDLKIKLKYLQNRKWLRIT